MQIEKDKVVTFHYCVTEQDGTVLEDSHEVHPLSYLHGHEGMIQGIQDALAGKQSGDKVNITLTPEQGYGERHEDAIRRVSINHIHREGKAKPKLKPGMLVELNTQQGPMPAMVVKVGLKTVDVDVNHPYAGKTLTFDMEVVDVRDALPEEIEHGHVHGEGGVHH